MEKFKKELIKLKRCVNVKIYQTKEYKKDHNTGRIKDKK